MTTELGLRSVVYKVLTFGHLNGHLNDIKEFLCSFRLEGPSIRIPVVVPSNCQPTHLVSEVPSTKRNNKKSGVVIILHLEGDVTRHSTVVFPTPVTDPELGSDFVPVKDTDHDAM